MLEEHNDSTITSRKRRFEATKHVKNHSQRTTFHCTWGTAINGCENRSKYVPKIHLKIVPWRFMRDIKRALQTCHRTKPLFALEPLPGISVFQPTAWDLGPHLYRYIYIYIYVVGARVCTKPPSPPGGFRAASHPGAMPARNPPGGRGGFVQMTLPTYHRESRRRFQFIYNCFYLNRYLF